MPCPYGKPCCKFSSALEGYDIDVFYGKTPDAFFNKPDYVIPPASLPKDSDVYKKINKPILELNDVHIMKRSILR